RVELAEIQLIDDRQQVNLKGHDMQHRPLDADRQLLALNLDVDERLSQLEYPQKLNVVAGQIAQSPQIGQFMIRKLQIAQMRKLNLEIARQGTQVYALGPAMELIFGFGR